ncbi:MAG: phosphoribosyltransferase family protein [Trueperaceae bacterium]|nr:phosphoribosyltransferase family protein [Trueperaceae bacterium]
MIFEDRRHAGRLLADAVLERLGPPGAGERRVVLGLPRGGVPVAAVVAEALDAPLDVLVVRKLGAPGHEEYAIGAIASGGAKTVDEAAVVRLGIDAATLADLEARERAELGARERRFGADGERPDVRGATVVVVDDGVATGATMRAALAALRRRGPARVVVAIPLAPADTLARLRREADAVVCLEAPDPFHAVGQGYAAFPQVSDDAVARLLADARRERT